MGPEGPDPEGPGRGQCREVRILNKVVRWTEDGILYKSDQRHSEIAVRAMGLEGAKAGRSDGWHARRAEGSKRACGSPEGRDRGRVSRAQRQRRQRIPRSRRALQLPCS